jgi:hypothetical protein
VNDTNRRVRCALAFTVFALFGVAYADANKDYLQKEVAGRVVRLPMLPGFASSCEENAAVAERARNMTPQTHDFLTCASDLKKWNDLKAGKTSSDFYPLLILAVQRHHPGGPFTEDEFTKLTKAAHAKLGDMIESEKKIPRSVRDTDEALSAGGSRRSTSEYVQKMQGFFDAPSTLPSFSFVTSRSYTVSEGGRARAIREITGISTIYYHGELLQLMVLDSVGPNGDSFRPMEITKHWLNAFNALN